MNTLVKKSLVLAIVLSTTVLSAEEAKKQIMARPLPVKKLPVVTPNPQKMTAPVINHVTPIVKKDTGVAFNFAFEPTFYRSAQADKTTDKHNEYIENEFTVGAKFESFKISSTINYADQKTDPGSSDWNSTSLSITATKPWQIADSLTLTPEFVGSLPLFMRNSDNRDYQFGPGLTLALKSADVGLDGFIFKYGIRVLKFLRNNTHTGDDITVRVRQRLFLGYDFGAGFTFMNYFHFDSNFPYNNDVLNNFFIQNSLEYAVNDNLSFKIGHQNGSSLYKDNYVEYNLRLFNEESSEYFAGLGLSF